MLSDQTIKTILEKINDGTINPNLKTYVFSRENGFPTIGIEAENEAEAREIADIRMKKIVDLVDVTPTFHFGMTVDEIKFEAKKRGILNV